jgi:hypothetical protein
MESDLHPALFDIVDRMQSTSYGGLSVVMGWRVTSSARTRKIRAALEFAGSFEGFGPLERRHRYRGSEACSWSNEITEMLRVPRRSVARLNALDQAR